jgi:hypothetical protein
VKAASARASYPFLQPASRAGQDRARGTAERAFLAGGYLPDALELELVTKVPTRHGSLLLPVAVSLRPSSGEVDFGAGPVD